MGGRKPSVSQEDAIKIIKKFMHHFKDGQLPASSDAVWREMAAATKNKWSPEACCLYLKYDRNFCLSKAKKELGIIDPPKLDANYNLSLEESIGSIDGNVSFESSFDCNNNSRVNDFDLILSETQWEKITTEVNSEIKLKPRVWANDILTIFWHQYRLPCAFVMKRGEVKLSHDDAMYVVKIIGSCKSKICGNTLHGYAEKEKTAKGLTMTIKTRDTRNDEHEMVKRPLNGERRKEVRKELKAEGTALWRKKYARQNMLGGIEPPLLPSGNVCRQARKEQIDDELGVEKDDGKDVVCTITSMKSKPDYAGFIHEVGSDPFFVTYSSPAQLYAYKEYCRINKNSVIAIDATGGVAQKLEREGQKSGHIFLYSIVINFEKSTIPVHQMLSETHMTGDIEFWLRKWNTKIKAPKPKQTVCDYSRALLCGISLAFNNMTIKSYVDTIFNSIVRDGTANGVDTLIRVDVAHFIHAVCSWKCWKSVRQAPIKDFFVRCVALMLECTTLCDFQEIFYATCIVGLQTYQDTEISHSMFDVRTAKEAMKKLVGYIRDRGINIDSKEKSRSEDEIEHSEAEYISEPEEYRNSSSIHSWVDDQVTKAGHIKQEGEELNPYYLPEFVKLLIVRAKEFTLWSSVGMENCTGHATSSFVEGYFSELKNNVLKHIGRPLRLDKFVKLHAQDIAGATLLFSSKMLNFNAKRSAPSIEPKEGTSNSVPDSGECPSGNPEERRFTALQSAHGTTNLNIIDERTTLYQPKSSSEADITTNITANVEPLESPWAAECSYNDSDLVSSENWRGKATVEKKLHWDETVQDISGFLDVSLTDCDALMQGLTSSVVEKLQEDFQLDHFNGNLSSSVDVVVTPSLETKDPNPLGKIKLIVAERTPDHGSNQNDSNGNYQPTANVASQLVVKSNKRPEVKQGSRKVSKYFRPCPEIEHTNALVSVNKKPVLLKNGSNCAPIKLMGRNGELNAYYITRTCAFDALVHVLMTAAIDDVNYFNFLKVSANRTLKLVCNLIEKGATPTVLRERLIILKNFYPCKPQTQTALRVVVYEISATDSIANVAKRALATEPSIANAQNCSRCGGRSFGTTVLEPNHETLSRGFGLLKSAIDFDSPLYRVKCREPCLGECEWTREPAAHVIIELDIRSKTQPKTGKRCRLNEMPTVLELKHGGTRSIYRLGAIVARVPDHFIAYCLRTTGVWQVYDDLAKDVGKADSKFVIEPHLAVYIRCQQFTGQ